MWKVKSGRDPEGDGPTAGAAMAFLCRISKLEMAFLPTKNVPQEVIGC